MVDKRTLATPLGPLEIKASVNGETVSSKLKFRRVKPPLPKGMSVDFFDVCTFEFTTANQSVSAVFECVWKEELKIDGSPETGEWLDAQEWRMNDKTVLIGTEDYEALHSRMPNIFQNEKPYPVTYLKNGLRINVPKVPAHQNVFLHFAIAGNASLEAIEESCWFAVGVLHNQVKESPELD